MKDIFREFPMARRCMIYYKQRHRFYHTEAHVNEMLANLENKPLSDVEKEILSLAIIYHDCVYDPKLKDNEKLSCDKFQEEFPEYQFLTKVIELIMATKDHVLGKDKLGDVIIDLDMAVFSRDHWGLIEYEHEIFKEYQFVPIETYIIERVKFLRTVPEKIKGMPWYYSDIVENINFLIDYVENREYKIGIFAGSFNPFHKGHENIKLKAEDIFDKIIIARGINPDKEESKFKLPKSLYNETVEYKTLVTELFKNPLKNISLFFVRGLRNVYDLGYEENIRKTIHDIDPDIKFSYLFCDREFEHISSSSIKGLLKFDKGAAEKYLI